jgi:putative tricarboxylic transport membrane protein
MRRADRLTGLLLAAFAGYTIAAGWQMGYWQGRIPGPGFAPIWIGGGLALAALFLLFRRSPGTAALQLLQPVPADAPARSGSRELLLGGEIVAATAGALLLAPRVGMMAATAVLLLVLIRLLGGPWRSAAGTAVLLPAAFYLLFVRWLQVPVPKGPWGF